MWYQIKDYLCEVTTNKKSMNELLARIKRQINDGDVDEAIIRLREIMAVSPETNAEAYYLLGNAYRKLGDWQGALNNYQEAIALDPESPAAEARDMALDILSFYNKDMFNQ